LFGTARALEAGRRDRSSTSDTILTNFRPRRPQHQVFSQMDPGMISAWRESSDWKCPE